MDDMPAATSPPALNRAERDRQAVELRKSGATYQEVADECGYNSKQTAYAAVKRVLEHTVTDGVMDLRLYQVLRLQDLLNGVWPNAVDPEAERPDRPGETQTASQHLAYVKQAQSLIKDIRDLHCLDQDIPAEELLAEGSVLISGSTMETVEMMRAAGVTGDEIETWLRSRDG